MALVFLVGLASTLAGLYRDAIEPVLISEELPFLRERQDRITYLDDLTSEVSEQQLPRHFDLPGDCEPILKAGIRATIDAFAICLGGAEEPRLELYRPSARIHKRYPEINDAEWAQLFPGYESALVASYAVGSGGFLTVTVIMWIDGEYRELTNWNDTYIYYATFAFVDVSGGAWKELVVRSGGKFGSEEVTYRIFSFDRERLEFLPWPPADPRYEKAETRILEACEESASIFDSLCSELVFD